MCAYCKSDDDVSLNGEQKDDDDKKKTNQK